MRIPGSVCFPGMPTNDAYICAIDLGNNEKTGIMMIQSKPDTTGSNFVQLSDAQIMIINSVMIIQEFKEVADAIFWLKEHQPHLLIDQSLKAS